MMDEKRWRLASVYLQGIKRNKEIKDSEGLPKIYAVIGWKNCDSNARLDCVQLQSHHV